MLPVGSSEERRQDYQVKIDLVSNPTNLMIFSLYTMTEGVLISIRKGRIQGPANLGV